MTAAVRSELRKVLSTRMWWLLGVVLLGYMAFIGLVMGFSLTADTATSGGPDLTPRQVAETVYTLAVSVGYVFPLVVGALSMTGEFRHKTITPSFLSEPRRGRVVAAKLVVGAVVGAAYGVVGTFASVAGGVPFLATKGDGTFLGDGRVLADLGFSVVAMAVWCVIGVGLGSLLTKQVAAVVVILAFTQFVEPILRLGLSAVDPLAGAQKFLPGAAAEALAGGSLYGASGDLEMLGRGWGALVLLGYALLFAVVARYTTLRRDVS